MSDIQWFWLTPVERSDESDSWRVWLDDVEVYAGPLVPPDEPVAGAPPSGEPAATPPGGQGEPASNPKDPTP